jgi:hypothetical protein
MHAAYLNLIRKAQKWQTNGFGEIRNYACAIFKKFLLQQG